VVAKGKGVELYRSMILLTSSLKNPVVYSCQFARRGGPADHLVRRSSCIGPSIGLGIETCSSYCDGSYTSLGVFSLPLARCHHTCPFPRPLPSLSVPILLSIFVRMLDITRHKI
jgi:hypothetical protein